MAFLTKGLRIVLRDWREEELHEHIFHYEGGIKEFVTYLNKSKTPLYDQIITARGSETECMWKSPCSTMIPTVTTHMDL